MWLKNPFEIKQTALLHPLIYFLTFSPGSPTLVAVKIYNSTSNKISCYHDQQLIRNISFYMFSIKRSKYYACLHHKLITIIYLGFKKKLVYSCSCYYHEVHYPARSDTRIKSYESIKFLRP